MKANHYDLVVIGSGPAGQKGAIAAAKLGKKVAMVDRKDRIGGVCLHGGTIPSKTLRLAILYLTGFRQRSFYGEGYTLKENITPSDLLHRLRTVTEREMAAITQQLRRNGVNLVGGMARFKDPHTLDITDTQESTQLTGDYVLIACGSRSAMNPNIPYDGHRVIVSDDIGQGRAEDIPKNVIVVGAGVIGLEYASMFSALGVNVTVIDQRSTLLDFADQEIIEALSYHMRRQGAVFRLGEKVSEVTVEGSGTVRASMESGKRVQGDALLYTVGRQSNADTLNLQAAGLSHDARGRIDVNEHFQTVVPHIYAAGDCIGFPALASTSKEQGRQAATHMFDTVQATMPHFFPYGIYTIPEISMVGQTEQQLTAAKIPYKVGVASYEDVSKGQMVGDHSGMLKMLFHPETLKLLGVHAIGEDATEIIHIGQGVLALDGTIEYFRDSIFNYPTFAEAYKIAAHNGLNKL
ncbi:MAG: Si-specific NAD(P)(+) transhydrogenase [Acidobacteriota bacterium]